MVKFPISAAFSGSALVSGRRLLKGSADFDLSVSVVAQCRGPALIGGNTVLPFTYVSFKFVNFYFQYFLNKLLFLKRKYVMISFLTPRLYFSKKARSRILTLMRYLIG